MSVLQQLAADGLPQTGAGSLGPHRLVEAMKHAFAMRMGLGDPGTPEQPFWDDTQIMADMLSLEFNADLAALTNDSRVLDSVAYGGVHNQLQGAHPEDHGTSHLSTADSFGNVVGLTTTINTLFGSKVVSPSTGILLNNQMDDFSTPGQPNAYGLSPAEADFIRPGKKPLSSMSPTVVLRRGKVRMVAGASGGPRIITATLQVILNHLVHGLPLLEAINQPRLHHQFLPDALFYEAFQGYGTSSFFYPETLEEGLQRRGHTLQALGFGAICQAVAWDGEAGEWVAASDSRKDGAAFAF